MTAVSRPQPRTLDWISRLISFDTTSRGSNLELIAAVEAELTSRGLAPHIIPNGDSTKANLIVTLPAADGSVTGGVMLSGHTDVVPVDGQVWQSDPFTAEIRDGRLYGRGASDMKAFSGIILGLLPTFLAQPLSVPLHLALTYDEEVGCHGAMALLPEFERLGLNPEICIVGEPTNMRVIEAHKSSNLYRVAIKGVASHSSLTPSGANAIEYAAKAISFIRGIADEHRTSGPFDGDFDVPYTTANVGLISGGVAVNTVPDHCEFAFEFRTIPAVDFRQITARIKDYLLGELRDEMRRENAAADIVIETKAEVPGLAPSPQARALQLAQTLTASATRDKVAYATEAGIFQQAGIDTVICGPGSLDQAHTADEYIDLAQITACEDFFEALAAHLAVE